MLSIEKPHKNNFKHFLIIQLILERKDKKTQCSRHAKFILLLQLTRSIALIVTQAYFK